MSLSIKSSALIVGALSFAAVMMSANFAFADAKHSLRIGSGQPMKPLEPIFKADSYFAPTVIKRVKAETPHEIKFIKLWNTVSGPFDVLEGVEKGLFDIGLWCACFEPTKASQLAFNFFVPFVTDDPMTQMKISRQTYKEFPEWTGALGKYGQRWLGAGAFSTYGLGTKFAWNKMSDLKGHKIAGAGLNLPWLKFTGATVIQTSLNEAYNALQSGVYEGLVIFPTAWKGFKLDEPAKHYKVVGWGSTFLYQMSMYSKSYNKLPGDIRKIIDEEAENWMNEVALESTRRFKASVKALRATGSTVTTLPFSERVVMAKALAGWSKEKAQLYDSKGLPGSKLFARYLEIAEQAGVKLPFKYTY